MTDAEVFDLGRYFPLRMALLSQRLTRAVATVYADRFQLSAPEWRMMAVPGQEGAMSTGELVQRTEMDKVRVSRAVLRLLAGGYITERRDSMDRRRTIVELSASGRAIHTRIVPLVLAAEADALADLSTEEREMFQRLIDKLEAHAGRVLTADEAPTAEAAD
jgi:DNA-binding MarR family transcriptional regulator